MKILVGMKVCRSATHDIVLSFLLMTKRQLKEPEHEILTILASDGDTAATKKIRDVMTKLAKGQYGKKILLKIEQPTG